MPAQHHRPTRAALSAVPAKPARTSSPTTESPTSLQRAASSPNTASPADVLQLQRAGGNRAVTQLLQRTAATGESGGELNDADAQTIQQARAGGQSLDPSTRSQMGSAFGADFSAVRVHTDGRSDSLNRSLNARAFTLGSDIFFGKGAYSPSSASGRHLLAHELTHVVQQNRGGGRVQTKLRVGPAVDAYEREADRTAQRVMRHSGSHTGRPSGRTPDHAASPTILRVQRAPGGVIRRDFQARAEAFERSLGVYAFHHPKANAAAKVMSDKVKGYIERKGKEDSLNEKKIDALWKKAGSDRKGIAGAVGDNVADIKKVFEKGNLRERMTHVYNFMAHHFGGIRQGDDQSELTKLATNSKALGRAYDQQKQNQVEAGNDGDVYFEDVLHKASPRATALAQQKDTRIATAQDTTTTRTVGEVGFHKEGGLLSKREARFMLGQFDNKDTLKDKQLSWSEGAKAWKLNKKNEWVQMMSDLNLPLMAGPSAHTNAFLNIATMLGVKDLASVRLAAIGQLLPIRAHSLVEIMTAAEGHGLGFSAGPEMYRSIAPLSQKELRSNVGNGSFPDEFGSARSGSGGDYQKLINKFRAATKAMANGLIDEDPDKAYKTLTDLDTLALKHIANKQKEKAKLKNNPNEAKRLDQRIGAVGEMREQLKPPLNKAKAAVKLIQSRKRIEELQGSGEYQNKMFHGTHTGLLGGLEKSQGTLISAEELEKRGIVRYSGEGDFFSSGEEKGPKKFISVGVGEFGLGTGAAYALATAKLHNYNTELYTDEQLDEEMRILQEAIDEFDPNLVTMKKSEREFKSKGQLQSLYDRLASEKKARENLPMDHPRRRGELTETSSYPLLFEFDGIDLDVRDEGGKKDFEDYLLTVLNTSERAFKDLMGERMVYGGTIDLKPRIHRVYCPAARIDVITDRLTKIMGHSNFEVLAIEALEGLPQTGFVGGALYETFATLGDFEDVRKRVIRAYAEGMSSKTAIDSNVFQLAKDFAKKPRKPRTPKPDTEPEKQPESEKKPVPENPPKPASTEPKKAEEPQTLQILLQQDNLQVHPIDGNGNCLFASVVHQLRQQGQNYSTALALRLALARNIRNAPQEYRRDVLEPIFSAEGLSVEQAAHRIQTPGYWNGLVGDTAPQLLANLLERNIVIYRTGGKQTLTPRGGAKHNELKIIYNGTNHYDSTLPGHQPVTQEGAKVTKVDEGGTPPQPTHDTPKQSDSEPKPLLEQDILPESGAKQSENDGKPLENIVKEVEKPGGSDVSKPTAPQKDTSPQSKGVPKPSKDGKPNIVLSGHGLLKEDTSPTKIKVPNKLSISYVGPMGSILDNPLANAVEEGRFKPEDMLVEAISMETGIVTELEPREILKLYKIFGPRTIKGGKVTPNYTLTPPQKLVVSVNEQVVTVEKNTTLQELLPRLQSKYPKGAHIHWAACQDLPAVDRQFQIKVMHIQDRYKAPQGMKPRDTTSGKARKDEIKKITLMIKDFKEI